MGTFRVTIELAVSADGPWRSAAATVDTGATFTQVPRPLLEALGVQPRWRLPFELADGRRLEEDVGEAWLRIDGQERPNLVVFADPDAAVLLGAVTLETFLLAADPVRRRLVPVPGLRLAVELDALDRRLINQLQGDFPISHRPFAEVGERLGMTEEGVIERLRRLVATGALSRFGPILNAPQLGGERTLAALRVPPERFEEVAAFVNSLPAVSHNYERTHEFNMWMVLSSDNEAEIERTIRRIEEETGLEVINLPTEEEYFVDFRVELPEEE